MIRMAKPSLRVFSAVLMTLAMVLLVACIAYRKYLPQRGLFFHDNFKSQALTGWRAQGGEWVATNSSAVNNSNEIGSRLLTGSEGLTDYRMDSDVRLTNSYGDAGIVVRVTQSEEGTNAFFGYYAGLRLPDFLIVARMDYGYQPLQVVKLPVPVTPGTWYHLSVEVRACTLTVKASDESGRILASTQTTDAEECQPRGNFGLRSFAAGGSWRNVRVQSLY